MKTQNINRFSCLQINEHFSLKNRVVIPPMASGTASSDGQVTRQTLQHYQRLSLAKSGLLIVEYTYVDLTGRSEAHQLGISDDRHIQGLSMLANLIKQSGSLAGIQLTHSGSKSDETLTNGNLMGPSAIAVPVKDRELQVPREMQTADIELWKFAFAAGIDRAVQAGFDLVEIHAAHGYGLNQWLSAITNHRQDTYGKTQAGRFQLLYEIIAAARQRHPHLLLSVRIPGQDFIENGLTVEDSLTLAKGLEKLGVNLIHVSSGIGGWRRPASRHGEGYLVAEAAIIQQNIQIPVIGVGGIFSGEYIDRGLKQNWFSLATVGRATLEDPSGWAEKQMQLSKIIAYSQLIC